MQQDRVLSTVDGVPTFIGAIWPQRAAKSFRIAALTLAGSLALAVSAKLQVPFYPVPMTMQSLVVLLVGIAFAWGLGAATVLLYLFEGLLGLPAFARPPEKRSGLPHIPA